MSTKDLFEYYSTWGKTMTNWFDKYGLIHLNPDPTPTDSENGPLFTAELAALGGLTLEETWKAAESIEGPGYYRPSGDNSDPSSHMSHDNMTGLYCLKHLGGQKLDSLPILRWNNRFWLHPRDISFYLYAKTGFSIFLVIPVIAMVISCLRPEAETSGKMLALTRCFSFGLTKTFKLLTLVLRNDSWYSVARIYFKHPDHPVPARLKEMGI